LTASAGIRLGRDDSGGETLPAIETPAASGEAEYRFHLVRPGAVRAYGKARGGPQLWRIDDAAPIPVVTGSNWSPVQMPPVWLDAGEHRLHVTLPPGGAISSLGLAIPCLPEILPTDLAGSEKELLFADKTAAMVRALGREDLLPGRDPSIAVRADEYDGAASDVVLRSHAGGEGGGFLESNGERGTVSFQVTLKKAGVYTVTAELAGMAPSSWDINGCRVASLESKQEMIGGGEFRSVRVASLRLPKGTQRIEAVLRRGLRLKGLWLRGHDDSPEAYASAAKNLGLAEGPPGQPVTEGALRANLSEPALEERRREYAEMDRDHAGIPAPPDQVAFIPIPDGDPPGEGLPSDEVEEPYDQPVSPYLPIGPVP
ncbi:MAG: hypothetical protein AB1405_07205, partial [Bdellovibrionota bacterium]